MIALIRPFLWLVGSITVIAVETVYFPEFVSTSFATGREVIAFKIMGSMAALAALICFFVSVYNVVNKHINEYKKQVERVENMISLKKSISIAKQQSRETTALLTTYLAEKYPQHEKELFELLSNCVEKESINVIGKFPEIQSSDTLKQLASTVKNLIKDVYTYKHSMERKKLSFKISTKNPMIMQSFMPKYNIDEIAANCESLDVINEEETQQQTK